LRRIAVAGPPNEAAHSADVTLTRRRQAAPAYFLPVKFFTAIKPATDKQALTKSSMRKLHPVMRRETTHDTLKARSKEKAKTKKTP
jgi:hypothetical protein